ncbi:MAG: hypothetical protein BWY70_01009 [Bacteroidetes bacterium ADurb.Bin408]|nr:MAG: hypothetical protein BWY70_01009 [Bacteroidetes bacterium ADurb.Bin408]
MIPPLAFIAAYLSLLPFDINNGKLILQIINLIIHFFSAYLIYLIVCILLKHPKNKCCLPAITSFLIYTYWPVVLYFHTDIFFPEMAGQFLWLCAIYLVLKYYLNYRQIPIWPAFIVFILFFYSEWIAVFFMSSWLIYVFIKKPFLIHRKLFFILMAAALTAGTILFIQFASVAGIEKLFHSMGIRFLERSGYFGEKYSSMGVHVFSQASVGILLFNIYKALTPAGLILLTGCIIMYFFHRKKFPAYFNLLLLLCTLPVLLHILVFFNANALHLLLMARLIVPLSVSTGITLFLTIEKFPFFKITKPLIITVLILLSAFNSYLYLKKFTVKETYPMLAEYALFIKKNTQPEQSVFIIKNNTFTEPEKFLSFAAKRNIAVAVSDKDVLAYMKKINKNGEAVLFTFDGKSIQKKIIIAE